MKDIRLALLVALAACAGAALSSSAEALQLPALDRPAGLVPRRPLPRAPVRALQEERLLPSPSPYHRQLVVKFVDAAQVRAVDGATVSRTGADLAALRRLSVEEGLTFTPLIAAPESRLSGLAARAAARSGVAQPDLAGMLVADLPAGDDGAPADTSRMEAVGGRLQSLDVVEFAHVQTLGAPPPGDISPVTPDLVFKQGYLGPNPGVNTAWANAIGLTGAGVRLFDCEYGWVLSHEDLMDAGVQTEPGQTTHPSVVANGWDQHGTAVLGEICGVPNGYGITGMAPGAEVHAYTEWSVEGGLRRVTCITNAIAAADAGDIVLLEMQSAAGAPAETDPAVWTVVKVGTDAGVIVVGAAGNGAENLDGLAYAAYQALGDSGAIIVGAGNDDVTHGRLSFSTYGSRVNVQGWGEGVFTTGYGGFAAYGGDNNQTYTATFSGTSSASPFVASASLLVQERVRVQLQRSFTSQEMRDHLAATGLPQTGGGGNIGPFPNMGGAIGNLPEGPWVDLGGGVAGVAGVPLLAGSGPLTAGSSGSLDLVGAAPNAVTLLFVATSSTPVPFMGGTLHAFPFFTNLLIFTDPAGEIHLPFNWNFPLPVGFNAWVQYGIEDPAALYGVSVSNALRMTTQ